jgi:hypothetical protein
MGGACRKHGEMINAYNILVGKLEETRPFGRPRRRCEGNIKMDMNEIRWEGVYSIDLAQVKYH